jgi:dipeptidyl aminopeptidase/acylaminoacyl peptidase
MSRPIVVVFLLLIAGCGGPAGEGASGDPTPDTTPSTSPDGSAQEPSASAPPDGNLGGEIAYVAGLDPQIHLLDMATGEDLRLTDLGPEHAELMSTGPLRPAVSCGFGPSSLTWSPDGGLLAFAYGGCDSVVYVVDLEGDLMRVADGRSPTWSPDGHRLVFAPNTPFCMAPGQCDAPPRAGAWNLQVADVAAGTGAEPLSMDESTLLAGQPQFAPDGARIAYTGPIPDAAADPDIFGATFVIDADGSDTALVARGAWSPGWLPDGRILVVDERTGDLHAIDLETSETQAFGGDVGPAPVSPDGSRLLLTTTDAGGTSGVAMTTIDGDVIAERAGYPAAWAPDSRAVALVDPRASALVVLDRDGNELLTFELPALADSFSSAAWRPGT